MGALRCKDGWGGQLQSHEVGMSSMGAAPPALVSPGVAPQRPATGGSEHGILRPLALGRQCAGGGLAPMVQVARQGLVVRPERPSHHCDALEVRT